MMSTKLCCMRGRHLESTSDRSSSRDRGQYWCGAAGGLLYMRAVWSIREPSVRLVDVTLPDVIKMCRCGFQYPARPAMIEAG